MRFIVPVAALCLAGCVINNIPPGSADSGGSCGAQGAACCAGTACNSGLVCLQGSCQAPCGGAGQACCNGTACNSGLVCEGAVCASPATDGGTTDGGTTTDAGSPADGGDSDAGASSDGGATTDGGSANSDGGMTTDGGSGDMDGGMTTDGGSVNTSCVDDSSCEIGSICVDSACVPGCHADEMCLNSHDYCNLATNRCATGCRSDSVCFGLTCCDHTCVDTQTNAAANCGGCGAPACASGDSCCSGACSDTQTDSANCGACGNDCGSLPCIGGVCQTGIGLFGLLDLTGTVAGDTTPRRVLTPLIFTSNEAFDYQALLTRHCFVSHWDAQHPVDRVLNAGDVVVSGYAGGTLRSIGVAPSDIACAWQGGDYVCGYGMLMNNVPGADPFEAPFVDGTAPLGTNLISFSAAGGTGFGSFSLAATPGSGFSVLENLSQLSYSAAADTVVNIQCPTNGCGLGGFVAFVRATSNDVAHFNEPSTAGGTMLCFGGYGGVGTFDLGPASITFRAADIGAMLGGDSSIQTFETTIVTLGQSDLLNLGEPPHTDSTGRPVSVFARTGSFGVSHQ